MTDAEVAQKWFCEGKPEGLPERIWRKHELERRRAAYVEVKNHYVAQHEWVFCVDGDELWSKGELRKIVPAINSGKYLLGYRLGQKFATERNGRKVLYDNYLLPADVRVFRGDTLKWYRAFPNERIAVRQEKMPLALKCNVPPLDEVSFWYWHLRYLQRSTNFSDKLRSARLDRPEWQLDLFDRVPVEQFPWEIDTDELP